MSHKLRLKGFCSLAWILTKSRRYRLQSKDSERLIFMNTNWSNDSRIDCKLPFQLVKLIEKDLDFEELGKFENSFKRDELLDIKNVWKNYLFFDVLKQFLNNQIKIQCSK